ncbi:hypothetical protein STCU_00173 [Strigomonas culicis]|uniref:Uncharacterized protein n=1 Tax=Strigomonas culicis TaxID=28005 RepID=S9V7V8_9TRYP|nr:hypothetical protein STCU_00173 [Strigomonas culicis]|eukprot:EPY37124.1 hypothetical protein STCU_00173 [Strigomonas culicis]
MKRGRIDSDDDEDTQLDSGTVPMLRYAVPTNHQDDTMLHLGLQSTDEDEAESNDGTRVDAIDPNGAAPLPSSSIVAEDLDDKTCWSKLLEESLLFHYNVVLHFICDGTPLNDKLLAQYLPCTSGDVGSTVNPVGHLGLKPGWRWDGIVRGRKI